MSATSHQAQDSPRRVVEAFWSAGARTIVQSVLSTSGMYYYHSYVPHVPGMYHMMYIFIYTVLHVVL
jgi:hypothetical protein